MGVPYFQIKDTLEKVGAVCFSSHFALYRDVSRRVFEIVRETFPDMEQYSIDESFFTLVSEDPDVVATKLKRQVERCVGIPVSVGVSSSKTRAKYANSVAKRTGGIAVWGDELWSVNADKIRLVEIWGVGAGRAREFSQHGIITVLDLLQLETATVTSLFGIEGLRLRDELAGRPVFDFKTRREPQKSVMSTRSFSTTISDYFLLEEAIFYHLYQGVKDLEMMNLVANSLRIIIAPSRHGDFVLQGASKEVLLPLATKDLFVLQQVAKDLLKTCFKAGVPYKKAGIVLSGLVSPEGMTESLFSSKQDKSGSTSELSKTILAINKRHGKDLLQLGILNSKTPRWQNKKSLISPSYTTDWSELKVVKA